MSKVNVFDIMKKCIVPKCKKTDIHYLSCTVNWLNSPLDSRLVDTSSWRPTWWHVPKGRWLFFTPCQGTRKFPLNSTRILGPLTSVRLREGCMWGWRCLLWSSGSAELLINLKELCWWCYVSIAVFFFQRHLKIWMNLKSLLKLEIEWN